ncbi:MAG: ABC transporter permease [Leeuwenhoekiella sp.]|nr:MAG: ABC transporter permease [Leeuwenhoekiella sp.]
MNSIKNIIRVEWKNIIRTQTAMVLIGVFAILLVFAALIGVENTAAQNAIRQSYQEQVHDAYGDQPDRNPHRVSHYGYLVFRERPALSFFEFGIESFAGNSIFLEAHRQNTVNLSEAGFSNGMLRFGELSMALILQLLVPLFIFFIGYGTLADLKSNGVLKIMLAQGIPIRKLIWGKTLGIFSFTTTVFTGAMLLVFSIAFIAYPEELTSAVLLRSIFAVILYTVYFFICSWVTVLISAKSSRGGTALLSLIMLWMLCGIILPKMAQNVGYALFPAPSKLEFETRITEDLEQVGDSHDPDDAYYTSFREKTLAAYGVDDVNDLPFNYAGHLMAEGERVTTELYRAHFDKLIDTYNNQNSIAAYLSFVDPYLMLRNLSMAVTGTDMAHYIDFQKQTEDYRYRQTQYFNELHKNEVDAERSGTQRLDSSRFKDRDPFEYQNRDLFWALSNNAITLMAFAFWIILIALSFSFGFQKIKLS